MIKRILITLFVLFTINICFAQGRGPIVKKAKPKPVFGSKVPTAKLLNGQWRGYFNSNGDIVSTGGDNTEYVLELNVDGDNISGYSYSYFQGREYYVICSLGGQIDKATKTITVNETARIKGMTPRGWND